MKQISAISVLAVLMSVVFMLPACAPEAAAPAAPQVISFTAASDTVADDECPVVNFEVADCSAITILQDGEIIMDIEITVPGTPAAHHQPWQGEAYALTETQTGVETHYCPGVYPVIYQGSPSGRPATIINKGHTEPITETFFEIQVRSQDGQVNTAKVACKIVPASERLSDQRAVIIAPDCASQDATATVETKINYFRVKDQPSNKYNPPVFEFSVGDAGMMQITQDGEVVFYIQSFLPGPSGSSFQPRQGVAYSLTENQAGVETHYYPGIYPVGYKGNSNGKPSKTMWKFGDNEPGPSAGIEVCSPSGDVVTEMLPFFAACPEGCDCLTQAEASQRGCYTGTAWNASSLGILQECGVDENGQGMYCCPKLPVVECNVSTTSLPYGGGKIKVNWTSQYADAVTMAVGNGVPSQVPLNKSLDVSVTRSTCFTFTAENKAFQSSTTKCCVYVNAIPPLPTYHPPAPPAEPPTPPPDEEPEDDFDPTF